MISFGAYGLAIDGDEWTSADPGATHITVRFKSGATVTLTKDFVMHAAELLEFVAKPAGQRQSVEGGCR